MIERLYYNLMLKQIKLVSGTILNRVSTYLERERVSLLIGNYVGANACGARSFDVIKFIKKII